MKLSMRILLGSLLVLFALALLPGSAEAAFTGPCTAVINGTDMKEASSVSIPEGSAITYEFTAEQPIRSYSMQIFYGPVAAPPSEGTSEGETMRVNGTTDITQYAQYGVGAYKLAGIVTLADGSTCDGDLTVILEGNPLTKPVGATAAAVAGTSTIVLIGLFLKEAGILFA